MVNAFLVRSYRLQTRVTGVVIPITATNNLTGPLSSTLRIGVGQLVEKSTSHVLLWAEPASGHRCQVDPPPSPTPPHPPKYM